MSIAEDFGLGKIITAAVTESAEAAGFAAHKSFEGVSLKLLVSGEKTGNALSLHLVRVEPDCALDSHTHPDNLEIHEVISGEGIAEIGTNTGEYRSGTVGVIPQGTVHKVTAGESGLYMLAVFSPALA